MTLIKTQMGRRAFIRNSSMASGGLILGFSLLNACRPKGEETLSALEMPKEWFEINAFLKIGDNGVVTIMAPNPEFGQNVITSMPMILAEELDVPWENVLVEQAAFNASLFGNQFTGGSQGIRRRWAGLRMAGATAKAMLKGAAAQSWDVPVSEITASQGILEHGPSGNSAGYGEMASLAAKMEVPSEVPLKAVKDFKIVSTSKKNVEGSKIVTGKPLFGLDYHYEGALIAMPVHPPAFGLKLKSYDAASVRDMPGIVDVVDIKSFKDGYERNYFDTNAFPELVVIVGKTTWEVMNAKKAFKAEWEPMGESKFTLDQFGNKVEITVPAGLENSGEHFAQMEALAALPGKVVRRDGDPDAAFKGEAKSNERSYSCPFLADNCREPMNFFAHVTEQGAKLAGPLQAPSFIEGTLAASLGLPVEKIEIGMTRMGGGFGRRAYSHYAVEAALVSKKLNAPIKLVYSREDDMTFGIYRPAYHALYRAGLDENNNLVAFSVKAGGIPESPLFANRFPAGAVDNYRAEEWAINSNITVGAFRAPRSNFMSGVEQAFLDEVAELAGKDPIAFRLELLERAKTDPVGENNDYEPERYAGVLELVREKADWGEEIPGVYRGVAAYFCHNSYAAHVLDIVVKDGLPRVEKAVCAL